jgi:hypothetical protein
MKKLLFISLWALIISSCYDEGEFDEKTEKNSYKLKPGVVTMSKAWDNCVSEKVTGNTILLSSVAGIQMPTVGEILLYPDASDMFPYGFMGRVVEVNETEIITEDCSLEDTFEELNIDLNAIDLADYINNSAVNTYADIKLTLPLNFNFLKENESQNGKLKFGVEGSLTLGIVLDYEHKIMVGQSEKARLSYELNNQLAIELNAGLEGKQEKSVDLTSLLSGKGVQIQILPPTSPIPLTIEMKLAFVLRTAGTLDYTAKLKATNTTTGGFQWEKGWGILKGIEEIEPEKEQNQEFESRFRIDGKVQVGPKIEIKVMPFNKDYVEAHVKGSVLFGLEGAFDCDLTADNTWERFSDSKGTLSLAFEGAAGVGAHFGELWNVEPELNLGIEFFKKEENFLPDISNLQVRNGTAANEKQVVYSLSEEVLFPGRYGLNMYDREDNLLQTYYCNETAAHISDLQSKDVQFQCVINSGQTYTLRPVFNMFGFWDFECNQFVKITDTTLDENGLTGSINEIVPPETLDKLQELGIEINGGNTPPDIEGTYLANPLVLVKNMASTQIAEQWDMYVTFSNQNNTSLTVNADYTMKSQGAWWTTQTMSASGPGSFIVGEGNKFTVFVDGRRSSSASRVTGNTVEIFSGEISSEGIKNYHWAVIMVDDNGDPDNVWIDNGDCYMKKDSDGFSERVPASEAPRKATVNYEPQPARKNGNALAM